MIRILLVEDDPMVQQINKQFVAQVDGVLVVGTATNGEDALEKLEKLQPDLVLLDIYMPKLDGIQTIRLFRERGYQVDVIIISAASDAETIQTMLRNGAVDYIIKPFQFERLKQALERYQLIQKTLKDERVTQKQIDEWMYKHAQPQQVSLPKGLNETTLGQIEQYMSQATNAQSADEVAEAIGIARVTARRYLEYLENIGEVEKEVQYGTVGRPIHRYRRPKRTK
ncbi:Transcriptional regulatory protein dcuR [Anoxybacillus thermarum]|uniref:Transcriptional regulatory protein n=1 Tax=Anoxybacillus thermarum TaxID=404937 RepID=A0A0D0QBT1_9BACL|nr:response regulator [Anoxybacillus thermarum]KIQ95528.1 Transcriptional regulatory protein dcuR [Anoxybacillus thermarum]